MRKWIHLVLFFVVILALFVLGAWFLMNELSSVLLLDELTMWENYDNK